MKAVLLPLRGGFEGRIPVQSGQAQSRRIERPENGRYFGIPPWGRVVQLLDSTRIAALSYRHARGLACQGRYGALQMTGRNFLYTSHKQVRRLSMVGREGDRKVLAAMASHGADLSKPAHTIHYLYFKSIDNANSAARELRDAGYQNLRVHRTPPTSIWKRLFGPKEFSCIAETRAVPSESAVFATTDSMNRLAAKYEGDYDGWEASIEK